MKPHNFSNSLALVWAAVLATACTKPASPDSQPAAIESSATAAPTEGPVAALAYAADDSTTGRNISAAQAALAEQPEDIDRHIALATLLMRRQRETSDAVLMRYAEEVIDSARALAPEDTRVTLMHAMILQDGHRFARAADLAQQVLGADPRSATAHLLLGDARLELGDYEGAMDSVQAALDLHPDLRSYNRAAHLRWLMGDFDSALAIMELALDSGSPRDPESSAWCFVDLGTMFLGRGDGARALASAERALRLVPDYVPGQVLQARAMARTERRPEAIALLSAAMERKPTVEEMLLLAEWSEAEGDHPTAEQWLAKAERMADDDPRPMALYLARRGIETERALELARTEFEARRNIAANDALAMALARAGEHEQALAAMKRAMALGTLDANLYLHASLVHALAGRTQQAHESLTLADRIDADADPRLAAELRGRLGAA